jgi:hypothetical protein
MVGTKRLLLILFFDFGTMDERSGTAVVLKVTRMLDGRGQVIKNMIIVVEGQSGGELGMFNKMITPDAFCGS